MKITNNSPRVIGILGKDLMPDATMAIPENAISDPVLNSIIAMGFVTVDDREEVKKAQKAEAMEEARKQIMEELRAAGMLKEANAEQEPADAENAADAAEMAANGEEPEKKKRTRKSSKAPEEVAE